MRIKELDYLKGVMIILVITFHLVYIEHLYPYAKQVVYTFHMPVFLVISGYLMNIEKNWRSFLLAISGLAIPYIVMESGYIVMASLLPINEHLDHLNVELFFIKLLLHPLGPYWYLHSLVLCGMTYYVVFRYFQAKNLNRFILIGFTFFLYSHVLGILPFTSSIFLLVGVILRQCNINFTRFFQSSALAIWAFILIICHKQYLNPSTLGGILIVYLVISCSLLVFKYSHKTVQKTIIYFGKNSLLLYIFSPIFTILCKVMVSYFTYDKTGVLFLIASLTVCISGSLCIGYLMDVLRISPLFFRKKRIMNSVGTHECGSRGF